MVDVARARAASAARALSQPSFERQVSVPSQDGGAAAGCLDLLLRRSGERVGAHLHDAGQVTLTEDLDGQAVADGALGDEVLDGHGATLGEELVDAVEVDDLELHLEGVLEALQLGQTHVDRHLATLEGDRDLVTGLGALGTTTGRLALRALTATHTGLRGLGAGSRTQVVQLERHVTPPPRPSRGYGRC